MPGEKILRENAEKAGGSYILIENLWNLLICFNAIERRRIWIRRKSLSWILEGSITS